MTSNGTDLVENNTVVKTCREIAVSGDISRISEIIDFSIAYTLRARQEMNEGIVENNANKFKFADYHLKCIVEINKCLDALVLKINGVQPSYSWTFNK